MTAAVNTSLNCSLGVQVQKAIKANAYLTHVSLKPFRQATFSRTQFANTSDDWLGSRLARYSGSPARYAIRFHAGQENGRWFVGLYMVQEQTARDPMTSGQQWTSPGKRGSTVVVRCTYRCEWRECRPDKNHRFWRFFLVVLVYTFYFFDSKPVASSLLHDA